jgi:hypothetical protein
MQVKKKKKKREKKVHLLRCSGLIQPEFNQFPLEFTPILLLLFF